MSALHLDFETYSAAPLRICGGYHYARHESTEILCCAWAIDEDDPHVWVPYVDEDEAEKFNLPRNKFWHYGMAVPAALAKAVKIGMTIFAHNASFERAVWQAVVVKRHGGPPTKRHQFKCTAAMAAAANLPRSLDGVGMALATGNQKDKEGSRLLKLFSVPRKPTKNDDRTRIRPLDAPAEFKALCDYCIQDVRTERDVEKLLPPLHPEEQKLFTFDMQINERGLRLDIPLVRKASIILAKLEADIVAEVQRRTKSAEFPDGLRPTQRDKMMKFFDSIGVVLENLQADHVRKFLKTNAATLPTVARELLLLRIEAGKSATKKFVSMLACTTELDHRARGTLLFYGASTGRWCLHGDTLVLTKNRGNVPVRNVVPTDLLWDGLEWVTSYGAVFNGVERVIHRHGVTATPNHGVWETPEHKVDLVDSSSVWRSLPDGYTADNTECAFSSLESVPVYDILDAGPRNRFALANGCVVSNSGRIVQPHNFIRGHLKYEEVLRVFELLKHADHEVMSMLYEWPISTIGGVMRGFIIPSEGKIFRVVDYASIEARVLAWLAGEDWVLEAYREGLDVYKLMAAGVFNVAYEDVTSEQRRIGKNLVLGCLHEETEVMVKGKGWTQIRYVADDDLVWDEVEWVSHSGAIPQGFKDIINVEGVWLTPDHEIKVSGEWYEAELLAEPGHAKGHWMTYDLLECGPRNQFCVRSKHGMLLVHNCGYGLGGAKFVQYSEKAGVEITEAFAKAAVKGYRTKHRKIVQFWYDVERCSITAVREKRGIENAVRLRNLRFYVEDQWFCIELPCGRCLRYFRPKVVPVEKFGEPSLQLQFKTEFRGRLVSESTYGGKLVENITQAVARDLLVNGMYEAEKHNYPVYGTVHDEIITETDPGFGSVHDLEKIVCKLPWWGEGLPVAAEGFESYRYRK